MWHTVTLPRGTSVALTDYEANTLSNALDNNCACYIERCALCNAIFESDQFILRLIFIRRQVRLNREWQERTALGANA